MSAQPSASTVDEATRPTTPSPSGRLLLRMPPNLHAELARAAEREGVSLNGYITSRLSESVGLRRAEPETVPEQAAGQPRPSKTLVWALVANAAAVVLAAAAAIVILLVALLT